MKATVLAALLPISLLAQPDLIIHGGKIITVDKDFTIAEAMTVRGGRIEDVGPRDALLRPNRPNMEVIDLQGATVLPGLIDSHTHPNGAAMTEFDHPIPDMESIEDVLSYFRDRARVVPEGEWIDLQQVFITRLREQRYPTRLELDKAAPRHPAIFRTGPDASLNTLALKRCGIDKDFKIPDGVPGKIEKDPRGEPTGILRTYANYTKIETSRGKKASEADYLSRLTQLFSDYNSVGITTIGDRASDSVALGRYEKLRDSRQLSVRISASYQIATLGPVEKIQQRIREVAKHPLFTNADPMVRIIGIKTFLDGGMLTGSAYMRQPWGTSTIYSITDPNYRGTLFIPRERLLPIVLTTALEGLQFTAHSVGDGAVHTLLDVYQEVNQSVPIRNTRPCITHCNFMSREAVDALATMGVLADIQPAWLYLDTRTLVAQFGYERMRYFQPLQSLFKAGAIIGGGSDH
ncbi:MAG TPA: amidohydrolase family protein, partial [Verrucomicrobiae bacterium]|nr:amidohydrolase family protein [Verrucomicrobiae bacterium]